MLLIFIILTAVFFAIALFLGKEFLKKFGYMRDFVQNSNRMITWEHKGERKSGMYNIVLHGEKPFCALVGFKLNISLLGYSGFDYYGFVRSGDNNIAVISTYLGKGACKFQFFIDTDLKLNPITATSSKEDQQLKPGSKYPPHWYQRIGFYG